MAIRRSLTLAGDGSGELILAARNTYGGETVVEAGTLIVNTSSALRDGSSLVVGAGGTFIFDPTVSGAANEAVGGEAMSPVAPVPEPGTLALLSMAGIVVAAAAWGGEEIEVTDYGEQPGCRGRQIAVKRTSYAQAGCTQAGTVLLILSTSR